MVSCKMEDGFLWIFYFKSPNRNGILISFFLNFKKFEYQLDAKLMSLTQKKTNSISSMWRGYAEKNEYNHKLIISAKISNLNDY